MDYYKLLNFKMEPFSNSPDPRLFYRSSQHFEALQKLEISIRLKRGLNIIIGDIGTGKTTISRQLIQRISNDTAIEYYLILDPGFKSVHGFLTHIVKLMMGELPDGYLDENILKERIKTYLFARGIDDNINTVLVIDEGQKISLACLEVLRELLNFETNAQKLLQIVIFAQNEFDQSLEKVKNFQDRINFRYTLSALNFKESKGLIQYRLNRSFIKGKQQPVFSAVAFIVIYAATKGAPRKIVNLCHQVILALIIKERKTADVFFILSCVKKMAPAAINKQTPVFSAGIILAGIILLGIILIGRYYPATLDTSPSDVCKSIFVPANATGYLVFSVSFPSPDEKKKYSDHTIFLLIHQTLDFNRAFTLAGSRIYKNLNIRIFPFWCPDNGYLFNVIIDRPFDNRKKALGFLQTIEPDIKATLENMVSLKSCDLTHKGE
ncbi:ExeA family protein [Desulfobacula toluolica]|uniref:Putative type II secretory pathway component ExeA n=1 Tax=Desulfobacula toluolica (strain DSM 7467 / Tol2) TaxID=651182 RepID=K0NIR4_DESTT|nr:AAA family ATPase [Desulfobacula toluolica]CCK78872.1 putative type II secretory pathway component ExeA [Desulfobacula toluolica Tol2]